MVFTIPAFCAASSLPWNMISGFSCCPPIDILQFTIFNFLHLDLMDCTHVIKFNIYVYGHRNVCWYVNSKFYSNDTLFKTQIHKLNDRTSRTETHVLFTLGKWLQTNNKFTDEEPRADRDRNGRQNTMNTLMLYQWSRSHIPTYHIAYTYA